MFDNCACTVFAAAALPISWTTHLPNSFSQELVSAMYWRCNVLADTQLSITNSLQTFAWTMNCIIPGLWSSMYLAVCWRRNVVCKVFSQASPAIFGGMSLKFTTLYMNLSVYIGARASHSAVWVDKLLFMKWCGLWDYKPGWQTCAVNFGGVLAGNKVTLYVRKSLWLLCCLLVHVAAEHIFQLPEKEDRLLHWSWKRKSKRGGCNLHHCIDTNFIMAWHLLEVLRLFLFWGVC